MAVGNFLYDASLPVWTTEDIPSVLLSRIYCTVIERRHNNHKETAAILVYQAIPPIKL